VKQNAIQPANLEFNAEGTPVSRDFDDVYFSNDNGLEETRYVFLDGNQLSNASRASRLFVVAESGFGTGLNFLTLWQAFDVFHRDNPEATLQRLHFISFEKFPLKATICAWLTSAGRSLRLGRAAAGAVASPIGGCHRLLLDGGRVTLDLWFGDINDLTNELDDSLNQQVDAWFLDGFAPAKNPDMWTPELFAAMARLARPAARWPPSPPPVLSAAACRRLYHAEAQGFGRKREMLTGEMEQTLEIPARAPWFARSGRNSAMRRLSAGDRQRPALAGAAAPRLAGHVILRRRRAG
jgi:tRNA 5-methylaminomethyl-2-thiouridine biosynthesis bifunctional protein